MEETQYGLLKKAVADKVEEFLKDFQAKLSQTEDAVIRKKLESDEAEMRRVAGACLLEVQKAVGLRS